MSNPFGPRIIKGWAILDGRGKPWDKHVYPTKEAAEDTASRCMTGPWTVLRARSVSYAWNTCATTMRFVNDLIIER